MNAQEYGCSGILMTEQQHQETQDLRLSIFSLPDLRHEIATHSDQWRPLVFTNGCFDLLHAGHVRYLSAARQLGRSLVVGLNSDHSIRQIKPSSPDQPRRPLVSETYRAEVIAALKPVDAVVVFSETTAIALIQSLQPDIYVKGGDYNLDTLPEASTVRDYGGRICLIPVELPLSTTRIIHQILQKE